MWGEMAAAWEGHPIKTWAPREAQRDGQEKTSWWLGKTSKSQAREKKNSSDFQPPPHNCQKADELGTCC